DRVCQRAVPTPGPSRPAKRGNRPTDPLNWRLIRATLRPPESRLIGLPGAIGRGAHRPAFPRHAQLHRAETAMKGTVERAQLLKSLGHVHRVVERRNTIPILGNVLLRAENAQLSLKATDLDLE